ncbi:MAG: UDP-N-acetylglucosamine 1-carboxyvinyltransferase [Burkholderiales bacterium]|nr:UDP-N-acetylglucosamine 1-carboxyvinyltransferase [Burkholderiales bacterium]
MDKLIIKKSLGLKGEIKISGAKNAALPIICAGLLTKEPLNLTNVPRLKDISTLSELLHQMGIQINFVDAKMVISANNITNFVAPYDLVKKMRASILVLGPLLARCGEAHVSLPGGCAIGARPVDIHLKGLEQMGANIVIEHGYIKAKVDRLRGAKIIMDTVTVTGTENLLMAACLADGTTVLENCAREPEVTDLAECLVKMGAEIEGIGTDKLIIHGVSSLYGANHSIIADRIETGTYAVASVLTQGDLTLTNTRVDTMGSVLEKLKLAGAIINYDIATINIVMRKQPASVDITTTPYPGFPTDMQAQFMALNTISNGTSVISETIFENRYMHIPELARMGADIDVDGSIAIIRGVTNLAGTSVMATDLRASASLVLAGLVADGETIVDRVYHLDRGYESMEVKLNGVGANIIRLTH